MQLKRSKFTIICTLAVLILCSANTVYAWESFNQSVINHVTGEAAQAPEEPDDPDTPDNPSDPEKPDEPSKLEKPEDSKKPTASDKPNKKPGSSSNQNGKHDAKTGDTHQYLRYLILMLLSFILIIIAGVTMVVSTINIIENRRR